VRVDLQLAPPVELDDVRAQELADAAHAVCPSSHAARGTIEVTVTVTDD